MVGAWLLAVLSALIQGAPLLALLPASVGLAFENLGHFRVMGLLAASLAAPIGRHRRALLYAGAVLALLHGAAILQYNLSPAHATADQSSLRIAYANIGWPQDRDAGRLLAWLRAADPDLVCLTEYDPPALAALSPLLDSYRFNTIVVREDRFGMAIFSRLPVSDSWVGPMESFGVPVINVGLESGALGLWLVHPVPPKTPDQQESRDTMLRRLAGRIRSEPRPVLVVGDMNTTERIAAFDDLLAAGLVDARIGRGWEPSWPAFKLHRRSLLSWLFGLPFAIPIDHVLASPRIPVLRRTLGPPFGSDHLPILLEIGSPHSQPLT